MLTMTLVCLLYQLTDYPLRDSKPATHRNDPFHIWLITKKLIFNTYVQLKYQRMAYNKLVSDYVNSNVRIV
jgi:hypothetical protein